MSNGDDVTNTPGWWTIPALVAAYAASQGSGDTITSTTAPWSTQQPYLGYGFASAYDNFLSGGPQFYPNATYTPFSSQTEAAMAGTENRALNPPGYQTNYQTNLSDTLGGNYLDPATNPYLKSTYDQAAARVTDTWNTSVLPSINASFAGSGGMGGGIQPQLVNQSAGRLGDSLAGLATNIYGGNYQQERQNQMRAMGQVPSATALDYGNWQALGGVGGQVENKAGQMLSDSMNRFNYYQNRPEQNLINYLNAIRGGYGTVSTTPQGSPFAGALGGMGAMGSMAADMGIGGWPAWLLAGLGGILGSGGG